MFEFVADYKNTYIHAYLWENKIKKKHIHTMYWMDESIKIPWDLFAAICLT